MGRIASIDFGTVRIGMAITDERHIIASAMPTLRAEKKLQDTAVIVANALKPYPNLEQVIIGLPLMLSGKESPMSSQVREFAAVLQTHISAPILFWDERLTSAGVEKMLKDADVSRKKRAALSDSLSAISILQNYLDSLRLR